MAVTAITLSGTAARAGRGRPARAAGDLTVGGLLVVIAYLAAVYGPLSSIAHTTGALQNAIASARRVREIFALTPETARRAGTRSTPRRSPATSGSSTSSFSYDDERPILHDISFSAQPGEMVALVGLTGAGKSTLASLIPRFFEPTAGRVLIDGVDVVEVPAAVAARAHRARAAGRDAVRRHDRRQHPLRPARRHRRGRAAAARAAHAHEFIMRLPHGYDTPLAEAGGSLSGGERQRLGIARALLKDAPILILDEPTSSLDAISEEAVFDALRRLRAGPHDAGHRPSPVDHPRRRSHPRAARGPHRGAGHAHGAAGVERAVPADVRASQRRPIARRPRRWTTCWSRRSDRAAA